MRHYMACGYVQASDMHDPRLCVIGECGVLLGDPPDVNFTYRYKKGASFTNTNTVLYSLRLPEGVTNGFVFVFPEVKLLSREAPPVLAPQVVTR